MVDLNLAAEKAGVLPAVLASLTASYPNMDWAQVASVMPCRVSGTAVAARPRCRRCRG